MTSDRFLEQGIKHCCISFTLTPWIASLGVIQMFREACSNVPIISTLFKERLVTGRIILATCVNNTKHGY